MTSMGTSSATWVVAFIFENFSLSFMWRAICGAIAEGTGSHLRERACGTACLLQLNNAHAPF